MEYFFYCRDNSGMGAARRRTVEAHWSFMDAYASDMIARGPTLAEDGETPTGSMHIVDLPNAEAARVFAYEEPNYKAGIYGSVMMRRWRNTLGQKMWAFQSDPGNNARFLVIGHGRADADGAHERLQEAHRTYITEHGLRDHLIVCGPLLSDDGLRWVGSAFTIELPSLVAAKAMMAGTPHVKAGLYESVEIFPWRFGGRA